MEGGSPQLYLKTFGQSSETDKGLQKWDGGAGTRTSAWAHLLLCSADAWSRRRINTVFFCCECVRPSVGPFTHPSICFCSELRGTAELANHRSISVLLWPSGDLRCMASCDPDSFLLSPPAPPHWHSGTPSERGREGGMKERARGRKRTE